MLLGRYLRQISKPVWNVKRDKKVENQKVSCIIENVGFAIKYVLYCVIYG